MVGSTRSSLETVCIAGHAASGAVAASWLSGLGLVLDCASVGSGVASGGLSGVSLGGAASSVLSTGLTFAGDVKTGEMQDTLVGVEALLLKVRFSVGMELVSGAAVLVGGMASWQGVHPFWV